MRNHVVYCPICRDEIVRRDNIGDAAYHQHVHYHEEGHEPGIISGHFTLEEEDDE